MEIRSGFKGWWLCAALFVAVDVASAAPGDLAARLQAVEDRIAIEQLMMGDYPRALDARDWKTYAALFTADGELVVGKNTYKGPAAIEANFSKPRPAPASGAPPAPPPAELMQHVVANLTLQIDGDRATAQAYWQTLIRRNGVTNIAAAGHYVDTLQRHGSGWKFLRREIVNTSRAAP